MNVRRLGVILLSFAAASLPGAASATGDQFRATLDVVGEISPSCSIAFVDERVPLGGIDQAGEAVAALSVDCNQPLAFRLQSENGGLRHEASLTAPLVRYDARLELVGGGGSSAPTPSSEMTGDGATGDLGGVIPFSSPAQMTVRWDEPTELLHSGAYRDVITITVVAPDGCPPNSPSGHGPHRRRGGGHASFDGRGA